jgi:Phage phiEco32-like COOH.NH2 ligase-type 2
MLPDADKYTMQEDNVALEFNFPPGNSQSSLANTVYTAFNCLTNCVHSKGLSISRYSSAIFSDEELESEAAKTFGCEPDFNAWTVEVNPKPICDNPNLRTAGGHIHVSWKPSKSEEEDFNKGIMLMRALDLTAGLISIAEDPRGITRRELYGRAGAYRQVSQAHFEYRVLSNYWIFGPAHIQNIWQRVVAATRLLATEQRFKLVNSLGPDVQFFLNKQGELNLLEKAELNKIVEIVNDNSSRI